MKLSNETQKRLQKMRKEMGFQSYEDFFQWILDCLENNRIPSEEELVESEIMEIDKEVQPRICPNCGREFEGLEGELCIDCSWKEVERLKKR